MLVALAGKFLPRTKVFQNLALTAVSPHVQEEVGLLGLDGVAHSDLRPGGTAYFGERKMDVVTHGDYIRSKTPVRIVEVHGNRIIVEELS